MADNTYWRKSSRSSDPDLAQCVEVAAVEGVSWQPVA